MLRQAFECTFIPNEQHCQILSRLAGMMSAHYKNFYPDTRSYIRLMEEGRTVDQFPSSICLTGLAGIGKSMLMRAIWSGSRPAANPSFLRATFSAADSTL